MSPTHSFLINSVREQRECILHRKGMWVNQLVYSLSHQMVEIGRISPISLTHLLAWVTHPKTGCSSSSFDPNDESEIDPESWNIFQLDVPFRISDKSSVAKDMFVRPGAKVSYPHFSRPMKFVWSLHPPGLLVYYKSGECSTHFPQQRTFNLRCLLFSSLLFGS